MAATTVRTTPLRGDDGGGGSSSYDETAEISWGQTISPRLSCARCGLESHTVLEASGSSLHCGCQCHEQTVTQAEEPRGADGSRSSPDLSWKS